MSNCNQKKWSHKTFINLRERTYSKALNYIEINAFLEMTSLFHSRHYFYLFLLLLLHKAYKVFTDISLRLKWPNEKMNSKSIK